jgi:hypothetical protein
MLYQFLKNLPVKQSVFRSKYVPKMAKNVGQFFYLSILPCLKNGTRFSAKFLHFRILSRKKKNLLIYYYTTTLIKKKFKFSSYIKKFRVEQLQSQCSVDHGRGNRYLPAATADSLQLLCKQSRVIPGCLLRSYTRITCDFFGLHTNNAS